jgi:hypothetical protein
MRFVLSEVNLERASPRLKHWIRRNFIRNNTNCLLRSDFKFIVAGSAMRPDFEHGPHSAPRYLKSQSLP